MSSSPSHPPTSLDEVRVRVPGKLNLALCVGDLADDGYHRLGTVFHAVSIYDVVTARRSALAGVNLHVKGNGDAADVPADDTNLAVRAANLLLDRFHVAEPGVELELRKAIPVAGGMAGGSADAAATLLACSMLWDLDTGPSELHDLAAELGSDVPFMLHGGNALGRGRGTDLVPLLSRGSYHWVLALAHGGLSTPEVFRRFDELGIPGDTTVPEGLLNGLAVGDVDMVAANLRNDLQAAAIDLRPEIGEVLQAGVDAGALAGVLSGSGPTCAFLVRSEAQAQDVAAALSRHEQVRATKYVEGPVPGARSMS
ncbi:4-(cytidine 5'-diphospho)-2-C-methyl-D-erythritol kinase [Aestuariimicrobium ganziense]|uniref:4-(cytidine 5'-diphospho)-2-C-methyl-D-erythritol kinase n=1 Tax=Aestuariimicrobium ganziense TaxID=2773677 RepID=UPI00194581CA|nr:4-(cytidine 5'-diphospho)-2-C-methyl-D-erythritol kinase [Aestuariimicrobium ganziense]